MVLLYGIIQSIMNLNQPFQAFLTHTLTPTRVPNNTVAPTMHK